ncbi:MAG TPA: 5,10-methylenetetrahydrofolate reductase, partial [Candidatus Omnitrophica bacterium]|nr:5,10-methylenetetrahydrofolate reductase [Candidatus Omnitrophota bacterium]
MSRLKEKIKNGEFVITSEIGPPKGVDIEKLLKEAEYYREKVDGVNVTD